MVNEDSRGISGKVVIPKSQSVETVAGEDCRRFTGKKRASIAKLKGDHNVVGCFPKDPKCEVCRSTSSLARRTDHS